MISLTNDEKKRYQRHLILENFGEAAQKKLKNGKVLVVGAGGLGNAVLPYLAAAGVGEIGIVDFDRVEMSNLQRQILFDESHIGQLKAEIAAEKLKKMNKNLKIHTFTTALNPNNIFSILQNFDLVADCTDNFMTRYLINDACVLSGKTIVFAAIHRFEGQIAVFNAKLKNGNFSLNYRDAHPLPPEEGLVKNCAEEGVLGVIAGIIGAMQANEIIKLITEIGEPLIGKMLFYDALDNDISIFDIPDTQARAKILSLTPFENMSSCALQSENVREIAYSDFLLLAPENYFLLDVREEVEYKKWHLNGFLLPLSEIKNNNFELPTEKKKIIVHCQTGKRSKEAIAIFQKKYFDVEFYCLLASNQTLNF